MVVNFAKLLKSLMRPARLERATFWFVARSRGLALIDIQQHLSTFSTSCSRRLVRHYTPKLADFHEGLSQDCHKKFRPDSMWINWGKIQTQPLSNIRHACLGCKRPWVRIPPSRLLESIVYGRLNDARFALRTHLRTHWNSETSRQSALSQVSTRAIAQWPISFTIFHSAWARGGRSTRLCLRRLWEGGN